MQLKRYGDLENPIKISPRYRDVTRQAIKDQRNILNQMFCLGVNYYEDYIKHAIRTVKTRVFTDIEIDKIAGLNTNINHNENTAYQNNLKYRFGELYPEKIDNSNLKKPLKILPSNDNNQDSNNNDGLHAKYKSVNKSNGQNKICRKVSSCFNKSLGDEANKKVNKTYRTKLKKAEFKIYNSSRYHNPSNGSDKNLKFPIYFNNYLDPFIPGDYAKDQNYSSKLFRANNLKIDNENINIKGSNMEPIKDDFINLNTRQNYFSRNIDYINSRRKMDKKESQISKLSSRSLAKLQKSPSRRITLKSNQLKSDNDLFVIKDIGSTVSLKKNKKKDFKYGILSDWNKKIKMDNKVDRKNKFGSILNRVKEMSGRVSFSSENLNSHKNFRISTISCKNNIIDDIINYSMFLHHTLVEFNSLELQTAKLVENTPQLELSHGSFIIVLIQQIQCSANIRPLIIIECCFLMPEKLDPTFCNLFFAIETVSDYLDVSYTEIYDNLIADTKLFNQFLYQIDGPTIEGHLCSNSLCQVQIVTPKIRDPCNICWNFPFEDSWDEISATNHSTSSNETQATKDYHELNLGNDEVCATSDEQCGSDLEDEDVFCDNDGGSLKLTDDLSCLSDIVIAPYLTTNRRNYRNYHDRNDFTFDDNDEEEEEEVNQQLSNICYIDEYELNVCQQASLIFNWQSDIRCGFIGLETDGITNIPVTVTVTRFDGQPFISGIVVSNTLFEPQANERRILTRRLSKGYLGDSDDEPSNTSSFKSKSESYIEEIAKPTISREENRMLYQSLDMHDQIFDNLNLIPFEQNKSVSVHWQPYGGHQKSIVNVKDNLQIRICSPIKYSHRNDYISINQDPHPLISNSISDGQWNIVTGDFCTSNSNNKVNLEDTIGSSSSPEYSVSNTLIFQNSDSPETSISQDSSNYCNSIY